MNIKMLNDVDYWFTADTHFDHKEIIGLEKRPFASIDEMNEALIANWNAVIKPQDVVWHLGDFGQSKDNKASNLESILGRLKGCINLIFGNHDTNNIWKIRKRFASCSDYKELCVEHLLDGQKKRQYINVFHYPMRSWRGSYRGAWHLFGHCHGNMAAYGKSFDVGVMNHGWRPINFKEVAEKMEKLTFRPDVKDIGE